MSKELSYDVVVDLAGTPQVLAAGSEMPLRHEDFGHWFHPWEPGVGLLSTCGGDFT